MSSLSEVPIGSPDLAAFGDANNKAAAIQYDIPLPGAYSIARIQPLSLPADHFTAEAKNAGVSLRDLGVVEGGPERPHVNPDQLKGVLDRLIPKGPLGLYARRPSTGSISPGSGAIHPDRPPLPASAASVSPSPSPPLLRNSTFGSTVDTVIDDLANTARPLQLGQDGSVGIALPMPGLGRSIRAAIATVKPAGATTTPTVAIVEIYEMSSFLGDYGLGKTLQTYSLLPGERTTITVETWRSNEATRSDSSSIFDSSDSHAEDRFSSEVEGQAGISSKDSGTWVSSLVTTSGGGFNLFGLLKASTDLTTYDAATSQYEREVFSQAVARTASAHASQVNNSRQQTVQNSGTTSSTSGNSTTTVREISNTNLRRVLNFVFRELNQKYDTVTSLREVRLAFYNGNAGSAEVVPLSRLAPFLERIIEPAHRDAVARSILAAVTQCVDHTGTPRTMLQHGTRRGGAYDWNDAQLDSHGDLDFTESPLAPRIAWRVKPGPIGQDRRDHAVAGVVTATSEVVLRTDNIIVEALLGQADALDPYATALQAFDLRARAAAIEATEEETRRMQKGLELVEAQADAEKLDAWDAVFGHRPDIQIVPTLTAVPGPR